ncbi:hypothetical protein BT63DRAFT_197563 [Microthyrium microscopicum]|uniref:Uncharacterized protein n=1 Tax=Microthyrium microscopicum TaxID=703497 RepID=A0A6A6UL35_9PEZI|nr:hypothetical protein BT63DRAFT_197563 [Microthyrium microscopicum]
MGSRFTSISQLHLAIHNMRYRQTPNLPRRDLCCFGYCRTSTEPAITPTSHSDKMPPQKIMQPDAPETFPRFLSLPLELRWMIYDMLDLPTLAAIHNAGPTLRSESELTYLRKSWFVLDLRWNSTHCFIAKEALNFQMTRTPEHGFSGSTAQAIKIAPPLNLSNAKHIRNIWILGNAICDVGPALVPESEIPQETSRPWRRPWQISRPQLPIPLRPRLDLLLAQFENAHTVVHNVFLEKERCSSRATYQKVDGIWKAGLFTGYHAPITKNEFPACPSKEELIELRQALPFVTGPYRLLHDFSSAMDDVKFLSEKMEALEHKADPKVRRKLIKSRRTKLVTLRKNMKKLTGRIEAKKQILEGKRAELMAMTEKDNEQFWELLEQQVTDLSVCLPEGERSVKIGESLIKARGIYGLAKEKAVR